MSNPYEDSPRSDPPDESTPVDVTVVDSVKRPGRGIYLLPNLFTTATVFAGFYAIIAAIKGHYETAAWVIFVAGAMDGLDGRVARMTNTQSDFGKEYDSLADMVSFGLAPALIVYLWSLNSMSQYGWYWSQVGWVGAFVFAVGAALRLARFNTQIAHQDPRYFCGLPSPAAAGVVAGLVWVCSDAGLDGKFLAIPALLLTVLAGGLMVSNVNYYSFKDLKLNERVPFRYVLITVGIFILIAINPPMVLFLMALSYMASGIFLAIYQYRQRQHV